MHIVFGDRKLGTRRSRHQQSGYVLIMTLVLIAIAALSLAGFARQSLQLATQAIDAQNSLQRHWGATSCRRQLLEPAEELFFKLEEEHLKQGLPWPTPRELYAEVILANRKYRLWLTDEDAKLNLNTLKARFPEQQQQIFNRLVGPEMRWQLRPEVSKRANQRKRWFSSWGQVVPLQEVWATGSVQSLLSSASSITCWGSGKLNIHRVSDASLLLIGSKIVSQKVAQKILEARAEAISLDWKELVESLSLRRRDQLALGRWFSDRSTCYSLWLELEDGDKRWYYQWVQGDSATQDSVLSFRW